MHTYYLCEKYILFFLMFLQVKLEDVKTFYIHIFNYRWQVQVQFMDSIYFCIGFCLILALILVRDKNLSN